MWIGIEYALCFDCFLLCGVDMKLVKWHSGDELPKETGWYLRDYRNPPKPTEGELPPFSVDHFIKDEHGKFWYVLGVDNDEVLVLNDAWFEKLPWCKIKVGE